MNIRTIALAVGVIVGLLGLMGAISGEGKLGNAMNMDIILDSARILLGALLIYGGVKSLDMAKLSLGIFGVAYLGMFVLGLASSTLFGLAPNGLGWMDQTLHIVGGVVGVFLAMSGQRHHAAA